MEMIACGPLSPYRFMTRARTSTVLARTPAVAGRSAMGACRGRSRDASPRRSSYAPGRGALYHGANPVGMMLVEEMFPWDAEQKRVRSAPRRAMHPLPRRAAPGGIPGWWARGTARARSAGFMQHGISGRSRCADIMQHGLASGGRFRTKASWAAYPRVPLKCALESSGCLGCCTPGIQETAAQAYAPDILQTASRIC